MSPVASPVAVLQTVILALGVLVLVLAALTALRRGARRWRERRRAARTASLRPLVLRLLAGHGAEAEEARTELSELPHGTWRALLPELERLLVKVRGETHEVLVALLAQRGGLERARRQTSSRSPVRRARAAEVLGAARWRPAEQDVLRLLGDHDPDVRQVAARALGRLGGAAGAAALLASVGSAHEVPPRIVASALLATGDQGHPAVVAGLGDDVPMRRAVAAEIAGLEGVAAAVPLLAGLLFTDSSLEVRIRCARALGRIGAGSALASLVRATAAVEPDGLRAVATRALGDLGSPEAVPVLEDLLADAAHRVAANAAAALARCGAAGRCALARAAAAGGSAGAHAGEVLALVRLREPGPARASRALPVPA